MDWLSTFFLVITDPLQFRYFRVGLIRRQRALSGCSDRATHMCMSGCGGCSSEYSFRISLVIEVKRRGMFWISTEI